MMSEVDVVGELNALKQRVNDFLKNPNELNRPHSFGSVNSFNSEASEFVKEEALKAIKEEKDKEEKEAEKKFPEDCYSFISQGPEKLFPFTLGILVFLLQVSFLTLMLLSRVYKPWNQRLDIDNPDQEVNDEFRGHFGSFIHANASYLVRTTQFISTVAFFMFGGGSVAEVALAILTAPSGCRFEKFADFWLLLSSILRFIQGALATTTAMMLVLTSNDVVDIVLNFTAVHFISEFDNMAYQLAKDGFYGTTLLLATEDLADKVLPQNTIQVKSFSKASERDRSGKNGADGKSTVYLVMTCLMAVIFVVILIGVSAIGGKDDTWATHALRVQFLDKDDADGVRGYSGCYEFTGAKYDRRLEYRSIPGSLTGSTITGELLTARIGYCAKQKRWYMHKNPTPKIDPCDVDQTDQLAYTEKLLTFDISSAFDAKWVTPKNKPIELFFWDNDDNLKDDKGRKYLKCPLRTGDGVCHEELNYVQYDFDGGDCCPTASADDLVNVLKPLRNIEKYPNGTHPCKESVLSISGSDISGTIPGDIIEDLKEVKTISLQDNSISGSIPRQIGNMTGLTSIYLGNNYLNGTIPTRMFDLESLTALSLPGNALTGEFPSKIGKLTNLQSLNLQGNDMTGFIPPDVGYLTDAKSVDLSHNHLMGGIQKEFGELVELTSLSLGGNLLMGSIPNEFGKLKKLENLDLHENWLTGTLSSGIGEMTKLTALLLHNNKFSSTIPVAGIEKLIELQIFNLSNNTLDGTIPDLIWNLKHLSSLSLNHNNFTGSIPLPQDPDKSPTKLRSLRLHNTLITGTIPTEIGFLTELRALDLSDNNLNGTIPTEIGKLSRLTSLSLAGNELTGGIPTELEGLRNLEVLLLNDNDLDLKFELSCFWLEFVQWVRYSRETYDDNVYQLNFTQTRGNLTYDASCRKNSYYYEGYYYYYDDDYWLTPAPSASQTFRPTFRRTPPPSFLATSQGSTL